MNDLFDIDRFDALMSRFKGVHRPWRSIREYSSALVSLRNEWAHDSSHLSWDDLSRSFRLHYSEELVQEAMEVAQRKASSGTGLEQSLECTVNREMFTVFLVAMIETAMRRYPRVKNGDAPDIDPLLDEFPGRSERAVDSGAEPVARSFELVPGSTALSFSDEIYERYKSAFKKLARE